MKQVLKSYHFWIILAIMACGAVLYYADRIPVIQDIGTLAPIQLARYTTHRILSIIPVAYATLIFGFRAGVIVAIFISLALLPRALFFADPRTESLAEIAAFLFISLLLTWLIYRQQRAVRGLETAQKQLLVNVETMKEKEKRLAVLNQISSAVSQSLELEQVLSRAIDSVVDAMNADVALIFLLDEGAGLLTLTAHRGISGEFAQGVDRIKLGEGFNGRVAQSGEPLFVEDASTDPRLTRDTVKEHEIRSEIIVPLRSKEKVNGTLCVAMHSHRQFKPEEVELLTIIGYQIGVAVENASLYKKQQTITVKLLLSEERYRGLFENSSEAIFVCTTAGRIISINHAGEKLTGYAQEELLDTSIYQLFAGASPETIKHSFSDPVETEPVEETEETKIKRRDGTEAFVQLKVSPILRGEEIIGLQALVRDITGERQLRQNMEYYIKQITRVQEDERLRISRELHDDTVQVLASLSRGLDSLLLRAKNLPEQVTQQLNKLRETADSALEGVRRFSQDLRPSVLDDLGLLPALDWLTTSLEKQSGIKAKIGVTGEQYRLSPEKELTIFRITQEALNNIKKHSHASNVDITVDFGNDALTLIISDNGKGFNMPLRASELIRSGKMGIMGMRERARLIGGTMILQAETGAGTTLTLRVPK